MSVAFLVCSRCKRKLDAPGTQDDQVSCSVMRVKQSEGDDTLRSDAMGTF